MLNKIKLFKIIKKLKTLDFKNVPLNTKLLQNKVTSFEATRIVDVAKRASITFINI